jgi:hypothetical protein
MVHIVTARPYKVNRDPNYGLGDPSFSINKNMQAIYKGCPESNVQCFFRSKYLLKSNQI